MLCFYILLSRSDKNREVQEPQVPAGGFRGQRPLSFPFFAHPESPADLRRLMGVKAPDTEGG